MCQSNAYLIQDGREELILEDVVSIKPEGEKILLTSLFGDRKVVDAEIDTIDLLHNKIILDKRA